ncbi:MAG: helix-turn-helix transcriptional regulator [Anaerolineae bacterium]|uniref:helix-turn-helix domain-containing protein n=1 Tax=Candidatus Amarolinea dominans TaxID=3140696 RepID=UPI001D7C54D8|nr:helix-turn-helix transcriptional regulator [Anaerolineae bacterium]MBK7203372.1 helix-turn-helix transcriptional regulator [Anaerolineae bacterium]MBK9095532.1 helix-turn-helix transcriptional regulator [Anaerolineae bacterium]
MPKSLLHKLGDNIRQHRLAKGLSQEKLAELTGLHRTYVGSVERGERNISLLNLARIATALDASLSDLVSGVEQ